MRPIIPSKESIAERCVIAESGCWEWSKSLNADGYGLYQVIGEALAHRVSYRVHVGPIPKGMSILHLCDNRKCVRPDHLYPGTHKTNMEDMSRRERTSTTKLTAEQVVSIRADTRAHADIARAYGMSHGAIQHIIHRRSWRHLP